MPKVVRSMLVDGDKPKVGSEMNMLGVRISPHPRPDVPVDANGNVRPRTGGMSVAPDWRKLPFFLIPKRLKPLFPRARGSNDLVCWSMGEGEFETSALNDDLDLCVDQVPLAKHGVIGPKLEVSIDEFQESLARTCEQWVKDE